MASIKRALLWGSWAFCLALALVSMVMVIQGILRDTRAGEPDVRVDFSTAFDWVEVPFRLWGADRYRLSLSSVNHRPERAGRPLEAVFEVAVVDPEGAVVFGKRYAAGATGHTLPSNYGGALLETLELDDWPWRAWRLKVRVLEPDPEFKTGMSRIALWTERDDPGMGGLINYAMIIPAGVFLLLAFVFSGLLASRGSRWPLVVTSVSMVGFLAFFVG